MENKIRSLGSLLSEYRKWEIAASWFDSLYIPHIEEIWWTLEGKELYVHHMVIDNRALWGAMKDSYHSGELHNLSLFSPEGDGSPHRIDKLPPDVLRWTKEEGARGRMQCLEEVICKWEIEEGAALWIVFKTTYHANSKSAYEGGGIYSRELHSIHRSLSLAGEALLELWKDYLDSDWIEEIVYEHTEKVTEFFLERGKIVGYKDQGEVMQEEVDSLSREEQIQLIQVVGGGPIVRGYALPC